MKMPDIDLELVGLGIVFFDPESFSGINEGNDFFEGHFDNPEWILDQSNQFKIVCLSTGGPGDYRLIFPEEDISGYSFAGSISVKDKRILVCDVYLFMDYSREYAEEIFVDNGIYQIFVKRDRMTIYVILLKVESGTRIDQMLQL